MTKIEKKRTYQEAAKAMRAAGASIAQIAARFEVSEPYASSWVRGVKCPVSHQALAARRAAEQWRENAEPARLVARRMRAEGRTYQEIVTLLRVSKPTAIKWCRDIRPRVSVKGFEKLNAKLWAAGIPPEERQRVIEKARAEQRQRVAA